MGQTYVKQYGIDMRFQHPDYKMLSKYKTNAAKNWTSYKMVSPKYKTRTEMTTTWWVMHVQKTARILKSMPSEMI